MFMLDMLDGQHVLFYSHYLVSKKKNDGSIAIIILIIYFYNLIYMSINEWIKSNVSFFIYFCQYYSMNHISVQNFVPR